MPSDRNLPAGFEPFEKLIFCSNELENVPIPFMWAGAVPLLIGRGLAPRVWLNCPILEGGKNIWAPLVRDNLPAHEWMQVVERRQQIEIRARGEVLLRCEKLDSDSAAVTLLDLRPIGIKIHGTESWLVAGVVKMAKNSYFNCGVMLQL
jgi:hypothetical protein